MEIRQKVKRVREVSSGWFSRAKHLWRNPDTELVFQNHESCHERSKPTELSSTGSPVHECAPTHTSYTHTIISENTYSKSPKTYVLKYS